jgi:hypothetical protein
MLGIEYLHFAGSVSTFRMLATLARGWHIKMCVGLAREMSALPEK